MLAFVCCIACHTWAYCPWLCSDRFPPSSRSGDRPLALLDEYPILEIQFLQSSVEVHWLHSFRSLSLFRKFLPSCPRPSVGIFSTTFLDWLHVRRSGQYMGRSWLAWPIVLPGIWVVFLESDIWNLISWFEVLIPNGPYSDLVSAARQLSCLQFVLFLATGLAIPIIVPSVPSITAGLYALSCVLPPLPDFGSPSMTPILKLLDVVNGLSFSGVLV